MNQILLDKGLPTGTSLENQVTLRLHRWKVLDRTQYRIGKYRLDFAWPRVKVAIEADGPHHWRPDVAMKDVVRDSYLRSQGWLVFRVDATTGTLDGQLLRAVEVVRSLQGGSD
jgi:very-short-patch-repair endonuclease